MIRKLSIVVVLLGIIVAVMGIVYIYQGVSKEMQVRDALRDEKVSYLLPREEVERGNVIDTTEEVQRVADTIRAHRHDIATTYSDLLKGGQYDPTNLQQLIYSQAMNLENYLYMVVLAFGLTTVVVTSGGALIAIGISLVLVGLGLFHLGRGAEVCLKH